MDNRPVPPAELTAAVTAKHMQPVQPPVSPCSLCRQPNPTVIMVPVVVATRCAEGRILFRRGEPWCRPCAMLVHGVDSYRHITLTPGAR